MAPFPYLPMTAIMTGLVSQLITQMSLFSYAGFMVEYLGVVDDKDEAGYYVGFLSSGFMIGNLLSARFWGLAADRHGSRFVIVCGLLSLAVLSIAFGFSKTFAWAFGCRFLLGLCNGMMTASKTLVAEVCGAEHRTVGMGVLTSAWSLGAVLGSGVGGILAEPARHHPGTFSEDGIFGRNPYLLSNVVGSGLALLALPMVLIFLTGNRHAERSNPTPRTWWYCSWCCLPQGGDGDDNHGHGQTEGGQEADRALEAEVESALAVEGSDTRKPSWLQPTKAPSTARRRGGSGEGDENGRLGHGEQEVKPESLLNQRHVRVLLFMDFVYSLAFSGFDEVYALWALSSVAKGGLEWSSVQIGQVFFVCGIMVLVFEVVAVPYLTPWLGVKTSQRLGSLFEVPVYCLVPLLSHVNGDDFPVTLSAIVLLFTTYVCTNSFFVGMALTVSNAVGPDRRGEIHGLSLTVTSLAMAVSPIVFASLFAYSINTNQVYPFNHHLAFYLLGTLRLIAACTGWNRITDDVNME